MKKIKNYSASILIIGNEILSGKTQDKNIKFIAERCNLIGIQIKEVRIIEDIKAEIINNIKHLSKYSDHVFTTGGIGPTHDDITAESVAKAFGKKLVLNRFAYKQLKDYFERSKIEFNKSRMKMAYIPSNSYLIKNPVSIAPGFRIKNVWVMAGVPKIMQAMFLEGVEPKIVKGSPIYSKNIKIFVPEGEIAETLENIQFKFSDITIGSYPFFKPPNVGTVVVCRGANYKIIQEAIKLLCKSLSKANIQFLRED